MTEDEFAAFSVYTTTKSRFGRRRFRLVFMTIALLLFVLMLANIGMSGWELGTLWIPVAMVAAVTGISGMLGWFMAPLVIGWLARLRYRQTFRVTGLPTRYELISDGLHAVSAAMDSTVRWSAIVELAVSSSALYIYTSSVSGFVVPKRAFDGTAAFDDFVGAARDFRRRSELARG